MKSDSKTLKDELRPLKDLLEIVKDKVDRMETFQNVTMQQVRDIKAQQSVMNGKLDYIEDRLDDPDIGLAVINKRLDANTAAVMELESTVKGYADMYKINDGNIRRMEKRLGPLEEEAGIDVAPELKLEPLPEQPAQP